VVDYQGHANYNFFAFKPPFSPHRPFSYSQETVDFSVVPSAQFVMLETSSEGMPGVSVTNKYIGADGPEVRIYMH